MVCYGIELNKDASNIMSRAHTLAIHNNTEALLTQYDMWQLTLVMAY